MSPHLEKAAAKLRAIMPINKQMMAYDIISKSAGFKNLGSYLSTIASFPESGIKRIEHGLYERVK